MSFAGILLALCFYKTCFLGQFVDCAVLKGRQPYPLASSYGSSPQSSMQSPEDLFSTTQDSLLITSDTTAGVTMVTKVVAITSFLDPSGTPSSSAASDPSDGVGVITKVVRVGVTTANTANCQPLLCSVNVAVSDSLPSLKLQQVLI